MGVEVYACARLLFAAPGGVSALMKGAWRDFSADI